MGKLHIKVASFPRECHPDEYPDLKLVNTVICEQVNFWLGKFKHILKHMNHEISLVFIDNRTNQGEILK